MSTKWIRTADSAKRAQQTQLMLIVDNMDLPIPRRASMYNDVMRVWIQALTVVENLVSGVAQRVNSGEALLGLSAWHVYPDICAIGHRTVTIEQKDHLVTKGGIVTLGLQEHRERDPQGITWSMPLAHLRYYGGPVPSQRTVGLKNSKVFFDQIVLVAIGSIMATWSNFDAKLENALRFLIAFAKILNIVYQKQPKQLLWPKVLANQAHKALSSDHEGRREMARLVSLGQRRYRVFLAADNEQPPSLFGLSNPDQCIRLLQVPDPAIATLRGMVKFMPAPLEIAFTRHVHPDFNGYRIIEYASIFPIRVDGFTHHRWITMPDSSLDDEIISLVLDRATYIREELGECCGLLEHGEVFREIYDPIECPLFIPQDESFFLGKSRHGKAPRAIAGGTKKRLGFWDSLEQRCVGMPQLGCIKMMRIDHEELLKSTEAEYSVMKYEMYFGHADSLIHLYAAREPGPEKLQIKLPIDYVTKALESQLAELPRVSRRFDWPTLACEAPENTQCPSFYKSLAALAAAQEVFSNLPNAEVDLSVVSRTLGEAKWAQYLSPLTGFVMSRASAVACICMFENGELNLQLQDLEDILAVSSANNLYASEILFCDPSKSPPPNAFRHVIGNVGRPGLVLLLSPRNTILREPDLESWEMINHAPFDGKFEDNFESTSLHLSLTGYEQPINIHGHGDRDCVVHFAEVVVSAHDRGLWHADLDLLHLATRRWPRISSAHCRHTEDQKVDASLVADFISIDNWYEALDRPHNPAIVRSQNNWIARLALAAIPSPENQQLIVTLDKPCCACLASYPRHTISKYKTITFLC